MGIGDVEITGSFTANTYKMIYGLDSAIFVEETYAFGEAVNVPDSPNVPGRIFEGWDAEIPAIMPAHDVTVCAIWHMPPAELEIEGIDCSTKEAKAGETVSWTTRAAGGDEPYLYRYHVNKDGEKLTNTTFAAEPVFRYKAEEPGVYRVRVYVKDAAGKQVTRTSADLTVKKETAKTPASASPVSISSVQCGTASARVGEEIIWTGSAEGGTGVYMYRFHLIKDGVKAAATEYTEENTFRFVPAEPGEYCVRLFARNRNKKGKQTVKQSAVVQVTE